MGSPPRLPMKGRGGRLRDDFIMRPTGQCWVITFIHWEFLAAADRIEQSALSQQQPTESQTVTLVHKSPKKVLGTRPKLEVSAEIFCCLFQEVRLPGMNDLKSGNLKHLKIWYAAKSQNPEMVPGHPLWM